MDLFGALKIHPAIPVSSPCLRETKTVVFKHGMVLGVCKSCGAGWRGGGGPAGSQRFGVILDYIEIWGPPGDKGDSVFKK